MKKFAVLICIISLFSCIESPGESQIIPEPKNIEIGNRSAVLTKDFIITYSDKSSREIAEYLQEMLEKIPGISLEIKESVVPIRKSIHLTRDMIGKEAYDLIVTERGTIINGSDYSGVFYGVQTFLQLLYIDSSLIRVPYCKISDSPRYSWRGTMLDVARHFFSVDEVKRYIDLISLYKFNILHLHLSDDQGWRIQIDSWPRLTSVGSLFEVGGTPGGFYTKEDYKEIVEYAKVRGVTIVPEVDMPGHVNAVLVAYPELDPDSTPNEHYTGIEVGFTTLDLENDLTYTFLNDVIRELAEMTPGDYIHIGGDEAYKTSRTLYKQFISEAEKAINKNKKIMIGWEEISKSDISDNTIIHKWLPRSALNGKRVILSPANKTYLDMKYHPGTELGLKWAGYIDLRTAYDWDPENYYPNVKKESILGIEAPLWSETLETIDDIEYMAFPRLLAYSELGWSSSCKSYDEFRVKVDAHLNYLDILDVNYYKGD